MALVLNNNMMAANATRNLNHVSGKLATSIQRMSSGLRINSAADDAAGLAIREIMRSDIAVTKQGIRNAADAISMIQTADGSLGIIDEKLVRMKELAEQAATGTYTTVQRDMINSEYQAMAAEIDRIANATNFNGIKLLDGSVSNQHGGQGLKIHFGVSNNAAEDYYFINMGDARATSTTGLQVGGDAKNDIWAQGAAASGPLSGPGCCTAGFDSLNGNAGFTDGESFSFGYNWDWKEEEDSNLLSGKYLAGRYEVKGTETLQDLVNKVNLGTQSRVGIEINSTSLHAGVSAGGTVGVCVGNETYVFGNDDITKDGGNIGFEGTFVASAGLKGELGFAGSEVASAQAAGYAIDKITATAEGFTSAALKPAIHASLSAQAATATVSVTVGATGTVGAEMMSADITATTVVTGSNVEKLNLWIDDKGNFTSSTAIASAFGFDRVELNYSVRGVGDATANTINPDNVFMMIGEEKIELASTIVTGTPKNTIAKAALTAEIEKERMVRETTAKAADISLTSIGEWKAMPAGTTVTGNIPDVADIKGPALTLEEHKSGALVDNTKEQILVATSADGVEKFTAESLATAINTNSESEFWAMTEAVSAVVEGVEVVKDMVYVFSKNGGDNNHIKACEVGTQNNGGAVALGAVSFENVAAGTFSNSGTSLTLGGEHWATMKPVQSKEDRGNAVWNLNLEGRDVGRDRDLWVSAPGDISTPGMDEQIINGLNREAFIEVQNASNAPWAGAEVRTQSSAQEALDALTAAIITKDKIRADLGAMQNRLENTMTNLEIQAENLQASESRISDVDVAKEMTEFTKNNAMSQAATSMLAQANSMSQMALSLLG